MFLTFIINDTNELDCRCWIPQIEQTGETAANAPTFITLVKKEAGRGKSKSVQLVPRRLMFKFLGVGAEVR